MSRVVGRRNILPPGNSSSQGSEPKEKKLLLNVIYNQAKR